MFTWQIIYLPNYTSCLIGHQLRLDFLESPILVFAVVLSGVSPSKKNYFIFFNESPLKMMETTFYFLLKALLLLNIFKLLS